MLDIEAAAVKALSGRLDQHFAHACELLLGCTGRIVVLGIGKSGHIGGKIAATLASTGSPAFFVHPAEASHGDLGMVTQGDIVLMLSNSGETPELADMIAHTRRFQIPLIGVASRPQSTLLRQADVALVYYAGHGIEISGNNYLVPIDARLEDERVAIETLTFSAKRLFSR